MLHSTLYSDFYSNCLIQGFLKDGDNLYFVIVDKSVDAANKYGLCCLSLKSYSSLL